MVKKDREANTTFIKQWLVEKKANSLDATQTGKIKWAQPKPRIEFLDSEDIESGNDEGSARVNDTDGTDT